MAKSTSYRLKIKDDAGKLKTVGKGRTPTGLKSAYSRARDANPKAEIVIVEPSGTKHSFGADVRRLTGNE